MSVETALKKILGNRQSDLECPACAYQAPPKKAKSSIGKRNRGGVVVCWALHKIPILHKKDRMADLFNPQII